MSEWIIDSATIEEIEPLLHEMFDGHEGDSVAWYIRCGYGGVEAGWMEGRRVLDGIGHLHDAGYRLPAPPAATKGLEFYDRAVPRLDEFQELEFADMTDDVDILLLINALREVEPYVKAFQNVRNLAAVPGLLGALRILYNCNPDKREYWIAVVLGAFDSTTERPEADAKD